MKLSAKPYMILGVIDYDGPLGDIKTLYSKKFKRVSDGYFLENDLFDSSIHLSKHQDEIRIVICGNDKDKITFFASDFKKKLKLNITPAPDYVKSTVAATLEQHDYVVNFIDIPRSAIL